MEKVQLDKQLSVTNDPTNNNLATRQLNIDIDTKIIHLAKSPGAQFSCLSSIDDKLSDEAQNNWSY